MKQKERSTMSWLAEFAGEKKSLYLASVILAIIGVACSIVPYVIMGDMVAKLIDGNREWQFYLRDGIIMAVFWIGRVTFHGISTSCSHKATFHVLATIRKMLCDKLAKVPLGLVKDIPSGSLKNIIVERVDSIETTLAHVLPEFTANLMAPLTVFIYLLIIDWRMGLVSLVTLVLGLFAYMGMMLGYEESYQNTVNKTKAGGHLSGGERQRISIARAMLKDAPIIILDEATAYTDPENEAVIQSSVARLVQGKTLIVIAHRLSTIADADRIFVVEDGRIAEEGTHEQLLENGKLYSKMWKSYIGVKDMGGEAYA